ncbi:MAG: ribonuclease III [bacterium]
MKITFKMNYDIIEERIGYLFKNKNLIDLAFTHKSINQIQNYERMEFLGDAVIGAIVGEYLYLNFRDLVEGELSKYRAALVRLENLYKIAENLKISEFILKEQDNSLLNGKNKRIISNVYEAVIGAVFLDSSYEKAKEILLSHLLRFNPDIGKEILKDTDFKTVLQELVQKKTGNTPEYCTIKKEGPDHNVIFTVCVKINGIIFGCGTGPSKKIAEQNAAKEAVKKFSEKINDKK